MAMVFTLASHMRESLSSWIKKQLEATKAEENERREAEIEVRILVLVTDWGTPPTDFLCYPG